MKLQDTHYKRQDIKEDSNLFIIIRKAKDVADISRWEFKERIYIRISVTYRIFHAIYFKKKDEKLWLYVDYWELNNITVKKSYLLLLILKL